MLLTGYEDTEKQNHLSLLLSEGACQSTLLVPPHLEREENVHTHKALDYLLQHAHWPFKNSKNLFFMQINLLK